MIRLSAAIMAHPRRAEMVADLKARLDRDVPVIWDRCNDRHDTGLRAIQAADPTATHHLVIQDDVMPCADLLAGVEQALSWVPEGHPASFYVGKVKPFRQEVQRAVRAAGDSVSWIVMDGCYWGPAIAVPTADIDGIARWWDGGGAKVTNYDRRLSRYFERDGRRCWYAWPSLVDHRGDESLVSGHTAVRHAHRALGADQSALSVDWSGPVADMARTGRLDRRRQLAARR